MAVDTNKMMLTPNEVAELLNLKINTLAIWRLKGEKLPFAKIGKNILYKTQDVLNFIESSMCVNTI